MTRFDDMDVPLYPKDTDNKIKVKEWREDMEDFMRTKGLSLALMHGRKGYYPAGLEEKMNDANKDVRKQAQSLRLALQLVERPLP